MVLDGIISIPRVVKDYTANAVCSILFDRIATYMSLRTLERASGYDHGSKDLLNFGFHVHAIKER
jgi:hypothetical protein